MKRYGKNPRKQERRPSSEGQPAAPPPNQPRSSGVWKAAACGVVFAGAWAGGRFLGSSPVPPSKGDPPPVKAPKIVEKISTGGAALQIRQMPESLDRRQRMLVLIGTASEGELPGLLHDFRGDEFAERAVADRWVALNPAGFLGALRKGSYDLDGREHFYGATLFRRWAEKDPQAALDAAKGCALIPGFRTAAWDVIQSVLATDYEKAGKLIAQMPNPPRGTFFPESLWKVDPAALVKATLTAGPPDDRLKKALVPVIEAWAQKNPDETLEWLRAQSPEMLAGILPGAMAGLGGKSPQAAAELIAKLPSAADRDAAGFQLAKSWGATDPAAAFSWVMQNLSVKKSAAFDAVAQACVRAGAEAVQKCAAALPPGPLRDRALSSLAEKWLNEDPAKAGPWIASLPADQAKNDIVGKLAVRWAENDPASGKAYLLANYQTPQGAEFLRQFLGKHAQYEPGGCLELAKQLPPALATEVVQTVFTAMAMQYDFKEATKLLGAMPSAEQKQEAVSTMAEAFSGGFLTVSDSLEWFRSLPSGQLKNTARQVFSQSTEINEEDKTKILEALQ